MNKTNRLFYILIIGSIWGFIEATLGMVLHIIRLPFTGAILASVGMCFMYYGWKFDGSKMPVAIAFVAASFKVFDSLFLGIPFITPMIFNPFVSIIAEGLLFSGVAYLFLEKDKEKVLFPQRVLFPLTISIVCFAVYLRALIIGLRTEIYFLFPNFLIPLILGLSFSYLIDFISIDSMRKYKTKPIFAVLSYISVVIITILCM
ncbi:MAG: hypothetical protein ISS28_01895 [Candidatus Cloacimonetes bacterium]|nr:hypothetical protein [Candidatus Cloacimonadota bacterium]MBL7085841.1 hypothetical protein [Candidatus Cloacimonadota bacterium]